MSRTTETKTVTKEVIEKNEKVFCDLCNIESKNKRWGSTGYEVSETRIHQREGEVYPEGGGGEEYIVDLCPTCFKEKLIPWLNSQGANLKQTDWDI
jgi:hypothetical protein